MGKKKRKNAINDGDHESLFPVSGHQQQQQQQPKKRQKYDNSNNNNGNQHQQKKKKKNRKNNNKNKKRYPHRREKYWIEDCQVTVDRHAIATAALTVLITRSELTDNHTFKKKDEAVPAATGDTTIPEADDTVDEPEAGCSKIDVQANESTKFELFESAPDLENDSATRLHDQAFKCATAIVAECDTDSKKGAVEETGTKEAESSNTTAPTTADVDNTNPSAKEISGLSSDIDTSKDTEHTAKRKTEICVQRDPSANAAPKKVRMLKRDLFVSMSCVCGVFVFCFDYCTHSIILTPAPFLSFRGKTFAPFPMVTVETESRIHTRSTSSLTNIGHSDIGSFPDTTKGFNSIKRAGILSLPRKLPTILLSR